MASNLLRPPPVIDEDFLVAEALEAGFVAPEDADALRAQLERTQADLDTLRADQPNVRAEVDRAIAAVNASDSAAAEAAFAAAGATLEAQATAHRRELARLKNAQATLLYPFTASKAAPLLCEAAELADTDVWYWIDCGRARVDIGALDDALAAFETAHDLAQSSGSDRDVSVTLNDIGDVRVAQGDLPAALAAHEESLGIRRDLAARDPGNAGWARDVVVSYWKFAEIDPANAAEHWAEVVARMEDMAERGILLPTDAPYLETARANLAAAR